jgi:hypothetical protein
VRTAVWATSGRAGRRVAGGGGTDLLVYSLEHGRGFAANAASGTLLGLVSLTGFVVVYGRLAGRVGWVACMLAGLLAFALGTLLFSAVAAPAGIALGLAGAGFVLGLVLLPQSGVQARSPAPAPAWDLPLRAICALALVLALTAVAGWLGPQLSGLLAPFPVITTVLATFTHAQRGATETVRLLRGMLTGFGAFALFCFVLAISLRALGVAAAFALATGVAVLTQAAMIRSSTRRAPRCA